MTPKTAPLSRRRPNDVIAHARAVALFASLVQPSDGLSDDEVRAKIRVTIRARGCRGCSQVVAYEFGDHPETAGPRMRWAILTVRAVFPRRGVR